MSSHSVRCARARECSTGISRLEAYLQLQVRMYLAWPVTTGMWCIWWTVWPGGLGRLLDSSSDVQALTHHIAMGVVRSRQRRVDEQQRRNSIRLVGFSSPLPRTSRKRAREDDDAYYADPIPAFNEDSGFYQANQYQDQLAAIHWLGCQLCHGRSSRSYYHHNYHLERSPGQFQPGSSCTGMNTKRI